MEIPASKWLSELEMEDPTLFPQYQTDYSFDDNLNFQSFSSESYSSFLSMNPGIIEPNILNSCKNEASDQLTKEDYITRPAKQLKTKNSSTWEYSCVKKQMISKPSASASSQIISFDNSKSSPAISQQYHGDLGCTVTFKNEGTKKVDSLSRNPIHAQDHVIAERRRREKINQLYIALSALLPSLKKADKATILADAIKYVKQLQERVKILEEQAAKKTVESAIFVKKIKIYAEDESSSSDENFNNRQVNHSTSLPEIETRISERDVLIRIHCEKNKGCLVNVLNEIERLNLSVVSSNVLPFGRASLNITIAAKMEDEFSMTTMDVVKSIRLALQRSV
ncbi:hypothetical protein SLA2020_181260 [Shorea laevis]